jgi:hypothetical protein
MAKKQEKKPVSKMVGMYVEVPRELRDALHELQIPIAETARTAFLNAVKRRAGELALGKKLDVMIAKFDPYSVRPRHSFMTDRERDEWDD